MNRTSMIEQSDSADQRRIQNPKSKMHRGADMNEQDFKDRTKKFGVRVIKLVSALPRGLAPEVIGRQLLRSGTSVGANYRAACRGRSPADVISRLSIVEEEADESLFWMELLIAARLMPEKKLVSLMQEGNELIAMVVASIKTLRRKSAANPKSKIQNPKWPKL
jgi:four helix bundle protein